MPIQIGPSREHGFDQPLDLLSDCHRRIEYFLRILQTVARSGGAGALSADYREAAESGLKYFQTAGPRHNQDEEQSLFPLLRGCAAPSSQVALEAIESLQAEHAAAAATHRKIDHLFRQWIDNGALVDSDRATLTRELDALGRLYQRHIEIEDSQLFPMAAKVLNSSQLRRLGNEMAHRRGLAASESGPTPGEDKVIANRVIDVRAIPGPRRHPLIFQTFESLGVGQALEIVNDHNPVPLRRQFEAMKNGQFSWEYLQEGPELWGVRIARIAPQPV